MHQPHKVSRARTFEFHPDSLFTALVLSHLKLDAGARKLAPEGRSQLASALRSYAIVPTSCIGVVAVILPCFELSVGALMGLGVLLVPASACASMMFAVFAAAVAWHTGRGRKFKCGCGGGGIISWSLATRDLVLSLTAVAVTVYPHTVLVLWDGPGWIHAGPKVWRDLIPVLMTVVLLAGGWRLMRVAWTLSSKRLDAVFR